jgi:hypothetical protein
MNDPIHIISLGAGVQSSTMALMAAKGEIGPMPVCAIFSDTKCEPMEVYHWLDWLEKQLPFPVYRVTEKRGLLHSLVKSLKGGRFASVPFYTESVNGGGKLRRQCTKEFKIVPITRMVREIVGLKKGKPGPRKRVLVIESIGISLDEVSRMKPSRVKWIRHQWPLIDLRMTRNDCLQWMEKNGYPLPPRSACTFCPYHSDAEWRRLKNDPYSWRQITAVDKLIRGGVRGTKEALYLHPSMKPITEVDFSTEEERGQTNMFNNECEGMCGV